MKINDLQPGDEVYWTDPEGLTSRIYEIRTIEVTGDIVRITDVNGDSLECFATELK